jgi:uncharacterized protein YdeI (YjbR/CyaY-like superfamily)
MADKIEPLFFSKQSDLRKWFEHNHTLEKALWVGFHKVKSGRPSITWPEAVDEAICFGWIDGIRKPLDAQTYMIRFTPRKSGSIWSAVNIGKAETLTRLRLIRPAGIAAFERRTTERSKVYSFEQAEVSLGIPLEKIFKRNKKAWTFFMAQIPSYRKSAIWWVVSAKQEQTRMKRLAQLIEDSAAGTHVKHLKRRPGISS